MECVEAACGIPANPETGKRPGRFDVLRHAFCSTLALKGVPALVIQKLAGHVSIETTQKYFTSFRCRRRSHRGAGRWNPGAGWYERGTDGSDSRNRQGFRGVVKWPRRDSKPLDAGNPSG